MATLLSNTARVTGAHFRRGRREGPLGRLPLPAPRTVFLRVRCRAYLGRHLDLFQSRRLQALLEQFGHGFIREQLHAAISMMNDKYDKPFAGSEQIVRNDQGPNGVLAGAAAGVADEWHRLLSNPRTSPGQDGRPYNLDDCDSTMALGCCPDPFDAAG
jgi:hypothetical protein